MELTVPPLGESIVEAEIERWLKNEGDYVAKGETLVTIASDKATLEVPAPAGGIVRKLFKQNGARVKIGEVIAEMEEGQAPKTAAGPAPVASAPPATPGAARETPMGPAARRLVETHGIDPDAVQATGPSGRVLKEDVMRHVDGASIPEKAPPAPAAPLRAPAPTGAREEQLVPMTRVRRTIAERLVRAKQTTAMLTTFNEVDMSRVMELRSQHQARFTERYGIKLGFMSFFVKAAIEALKTFPSVNGEIRGDDLVFKNYYDIGVAVGGGKGLTVPVIRDADLLSFAEVETVIADLGVRAKENRLKIEELQGGTFTISNGGIYGSMLSTPILNPPQSGILGMHNILKRPIVIDDELVIRPMMYLALSYDHRIVDGREAVQFLVKLKDCVENPERILLEI